MTDADEEAIHRAGRRWDERLAAARTQGVRQALDGGPWREAVDPYRSGAWERRLAWGERHGDANEAGGDSDPSPLWLGELALIRNVRRGLVTTVQEIDDDVPFAHALQPVVDEAWNRLQAASEAARLTEGARADLRRALLHRLSWVASRPLGQLFSEGRTLADVALARLADGTTPGSSTENYRRFCEAQLKSGFDDLLAEFPVLGRLLATVVLHWTDACKELLDRLTSDRGALEAAFGVSRDESITYVASGLSDPHRAGRSVVVVGFGSGARVVYKPRSVEIEARFHDFVAAVSAALPEDPLRRLSVLECDGYGYVEHASAIPAADPDSLSRFYWNAGRVLGILYLLGATDCHWENMIAGADQLLLVDAETLFEGAPRAANSHSVSAAQSSAADSIADSVLRTGMLPAWISVGPARAIDISALGVPARDVARESQPGWCFVNTDDMVWGDRESESPHPACLPIEPGEPNPLSKHGNELVGGFEDVLSVLRHPAVREQVRSCIEAFRGVRRRVVVRPTRTYVLLQEAALAPLVLRNRDDRALQLERLARAYVVEKEQPPTWPLLHHEISALEHLDIPYFEAVVGREDLLVGNVTVVASYYEKEGLEEAVARLERLSDAESGWQARLIRGAMAAHRFEMAAVPSDGARGEACAQVGAHYATDIARLITAEVLEDPTGPPTWLTVVLLADARRVQLGLVPPGLYDGRAGIAAFLYDCDEADLATAVLRPVFESLDDRDEARVFRYMRDIGLGLSGVGGLLRLFRYRAESGDAGSGWAERARRVIARLSDDLLSAGDTASDLVSGVAGLAGPVSAFHGSAPTRHSTRVLRTIGRLLLERQNADGGWSFAPGHPPLVGLSHGASGMAVALAEIAAALEDDRYAAGAARAMDFEASFFDADARNWPDLRRSHSPVDRLAMRSWCHGSVGVALARVRMLELLSAHRHAPRWREELTVAVESSIDAPLTPVDHLCCGNIGRAVVIELAGQATGNARWETEAQRLSTAVVSAAGNNPENYRLLLGIEGASGLRLPGLMTGLAGIGMHLLHGRNLRWARELLM
jgi:type 2 lantibiotic biosynthesis protein LanM